MLDGLREGMVWIELKMLKAFNLWALALRLVVARLPVGNPVACIVCRRAASPRCFQQIDRQRYRGVIRSPGF